MAGLGMAGSLLPGIGMGEVCRFSGMNGMYAWFLTYRNDCLRMLRLSAASLPAGAGLRDRGARRGE